ncbi:MAG: flagellar rod assembly protein/muramidase FlgJ [Pseudomonadota bacterium]|jgi:Rod binding domain-containing protein
MNKIKPLENVAAPDLRGAQKPIPAAKNPELAAQQFEAMLVKQMIDSMWSTVPKKGVLTGSNEESMYRDMLNEALANSISEGKGIGVKDVILKDINKFSKNK